MSLNGIMGIGISSAGVEDERKEIARAERESQQPVAGMKLDNLSMVQEDYVTLQSGVGLVAPAGAANGVALGQSGAGERGTMFTAIA
jgi:hypothetical protein